MITQIKITLQHNDKPVDIEIQVEFEPGEYVEVIKELPAVIKQINKIAKG